RRPRRRRALTASNKRRPDEDDRARSITSEAVARETAPRKRTGQAHPLPDGETAKALLQMMMLIRRFEERAGEMYAKAKIGGFLHLCIGEEAAVVGAEHALRKTDYLKSTYREHGQALARGTS